MRIGKGKNIKVDENDYFYFLNCCKALLARMPPEECDDMAEYMETYLTARFKERELMTMVREYFSAYKRFQTENPALSMAAYREYKKYSEELKVLRKHE